jgi:hypothetical protein
MQNEKGKMPTPSIRILDFAFYILAHHVGATVVLSHPGVTVQLPPQQQTLTHQNKTERPLAAQSR